MAHGTLRIYLGAAPGVGKTFAMLNEGNRRRRRGTDVVVGYLESHGRAQTEAQLGDLEVVRRCHRTYRGAVLEEMDLDALLARRPAVALVDEMAHTNVSGGAHDKRWMDIQDLLSAGIDVITTVNIQHLESLNDVVEQITGIRQRETVPDAVVRAADQIELVDMAPEALRRRMAHGNIYAAGKVDAALGNYFRVGNLTALRELALLWVADRVEENLHDYMVEHHITEPWETRERVVVAVTGAPSGERLIRRAARMAARSRGDLLGVHVRVGDGLAGPRSDLLERHRALVEDLGGTYHEVVGRDVATALSQFAAAQNATQVVLGASGRSSLGELFGGSVVSQVLRQLQGIDVHVMRNDADADADADAEAARSLPRTGRRAAPLSVRRRTAGLTIAVLGVPLLTVLLSQLRSELGLPSDLMLFLLLVVAAATVGGTGPALVAAVAGSMAVNWYFTPPFHTFTVADGENALGLLAFVVVGMVLAVLVNQLSARAVEARRAQLESEALTRLAAGLVGEADPVPTLLARLRRAFDLERVELQVASAAGWETLLAADASSRSPVALAPSSEAGPPDAAEDREPQAVSTVAAPAPAVLPLDHVTRLVLRGRVMAGDDQRVLLAFASQIGTALERQELRREADEAAVASRGDSLRTALLRSVSHDLRTPLASIKASVTSLLQDDVDWSQAATTNFLDTIDEEADRLDRLVGNLLDMSRLETGAVQARLRAVGWEDVVAAATSSLSQSVAGLEVDVPETLPSIVADPVLLERAVANVVANAMRYAPTGTAVQIQAGAIAGHVDLRVIDRGPGIDEAERDRIFEPFQRLGDEETGGNLGLGLAVARGFVEVMNGDIEVEDTPGGGATIVIRMPVAP